ncbi:MAG: 50S ribosomal protein L22 [Desulfobacterales bacterium C00003106]|jgi:large subunit ribosomal protein L22|nr:50S ribosomal protein L22 [Deltaproteobacteria bacterium]OEU56540.1 MAG: 50S ribosomal protein L22 [Desulfobacterales bacterium C00003106]OEU59975.1 MAG: 50S ribosomal protein L22 [Desulfobacterales bacterium C00003104]
MDIKSKARFIRISPRKVRKIIQDLKGEKAEDALNKLKFMPQKAAAILNKIMRSAVANANQKPDVDVDALFVKNILVDQGATLKRFRPRAQGRAYRILKRMSHITVILSEKA